MRFPLLGMIRIAAFAGLVLAAFAVGLGRMNPPTAPRRAPAAVARVGLAARITAADGRVADYFDLARGRLGSLTLPPDEVLYNASFAPWTDQVGKGQVVGRWAHRESREHPAQFGLARFSVPDGEPLGLIATERPPLGPPCWFPDRSARVLYAGGDGRLYRFDFDADRGHPDEGGDDEAEASPRPVDLGTLPDGGATTQVADPCWPDGPAIGGRAVVALSTLREAAPRFENPKLWWLTLDRDGTRILAAGRLTAPDSVENDLEERLPAIGSAPDGSPILAYLTRQGPASAWTVRVAPIRVDPETGIPTAATAAARVVAEPCAPALPAISPDGRWVAVSRRVGGIDQAPRRVAIAARPPAK